jgi:hypothetical protein
MNSDLKKIAEVFSEMSVKVLEKHLGETLGPKTGKINIEQLLLLQDRIAEELEGWEQMKGKWADAVSDAASGLYENEDNYQINVDTITGPWDVSEAEGTYQGVWVSGWLWVPKEVIDFQVNFRKEKNV